MADRHTPDLSSQLKYGFSLLDGNNDGVIDINDLKSSLTKLGFHPTDEEVEEMMSIMKTKETGKIDFKEFSSMVTEKMHTGATEDEIKDTLQVFDKDGNGFISSAELRQALTNFGQKLNQDEIDEMIREVDHDNDGQINYNEFMSMMKRP